MSNDSQSVKGLKHFPGKGHLIKPNKLAGGLEPKMVNGAKHLIPSSRNHVVSHRRVIKVQQPSTSIPSGLMNGQSVDFRIERGIISRLSHMLFKYTISNQTGANVVLPPTPFHINRVELFAQNGSQLLNVIYGQELWLSLFALSRDEFEGLSGYMGTNATYAVNVDTITNGSIIDRYLLLTENLKDLIPSGLKSELLVRVHFETFSQYAVSGTLPDITAASLILKGVNEPRDVVETRANTYLTNKICIPYANWQQMNITQTLAASSRYEIILNGLTNISLALFITVRPSPLVAATFATYTDAIEDIDIQNADGSSLSGHYFRDASDLKIDAAEILPNTFAQNTNAVIIPFSDELVYDFATGSNNGFIILSSFEKIAFTTKAGLAGGSYRIDIYSLAIESMTVDRGVISTTRS